MKALPNNNKPAIEHWAPNGKQAQLSTEFSYCTQYNYTNKVVFYYSNKAAMPSGEGPYCVAVFKIRLK